MFLLFMPYIWAIRSKNATAQSFKYNPSRNHTDSMHLITLNLQYITGGKKLTPRIKVL